jgi:hypothetical protein
VETLFPLILFGVPVLAVLAGLWLAIDRRRSGAVRVVGAGISLVGLAELGLLMEWMSNLCWDEGGTCGQPLDTLFDVMGIWWLVLAATGLGVITVWIARSARLVGRK